VKRSTLLQAGILAAAAVLILAVFRWGGADRAVTLLFYDAARGDFPLKDAWLLAVPGHTGLKWTMLGFWALCLAWGGSLRRGALYMAVIVLAVSVLKHYSPFSCPWDLREYGGSDPQAGRCLPAAHPLTGFGLFGLYLALRQDRPRAARVVLAAAWVIGLAAGAVQIARGAHFASHVLWTAWVAWALTLLLSRLPLAARAPRRA
jgi:membrane-associated PAP2 superfamily phosphatase